MPYGPAARVTDATTHGSPLAPGAGSANVLIGSLPAWRALMDFHACPIVKGLVPDVGGMVLMGSPTVLINSMMACRAMDMVTEIPGGPNPIVIGATNVFIGDSGGGGGGGGAGGGSGASGGSGAGTSSAQSGGGGGAGATAAAAAAAARASGAGASKKPSDETKKKTHWIKFKVVDEKSGLPISGVVLD